MGGEGVVIWRDASEAERGGAEEAIADDPYGHVAQELFTLSVHPTVCGERLEPRHVDLRPYAVVDDDGRARAARGDQPRRAGARLDGRQLGSGRRRQGHLGPRLSCVSPRSR